MAGLNIDLLVLIVVSSSQSKKLMANLNKKHFFFTIIDSTSGLFSDSTVLLLLGLNQERFDTLDNLVRKYCKPYQKFIPVQMRTADDFGHLPILEAQEGGAILYGMPVEYFEQI